MLIGAVTSYECGGGRCCLIVIRDLGRSACWASGLELEPSGRRAPQSGRDLKMVEDGSWIEGCSGQRISSRRSYMEEDDFEKIGCVGGWLCRLTSEKLDVTKASGWTLGVVNFSGEVLGSWDICHHPDEDQILITTLTPLLRDTLCVSEILVYGKTYF